MFDPDAEYSVVERRLPHWSQAGTVCFITWRTDDSIPPPLLRQWHADRDHWLRRHDIDPKSVDWRDQLQKLDRIVRAEFAQTFSRRWHNHLDAGYGACVLKSPPISDIVAKSLLHFDGDHYEMCDFVVMPNHVHLLAAFVNEDSMLEQCESWKHYTARQINQQIKGEGRFWQQDGFDHLVRTIEHFEAFRRYIAANPTKARLKRREYRHYSKVLV
jgi:type I restriction enzyme R subunit